MTLLDERLRVRAADKAQALGEIAVVLAKIDGDHRDPVTWERLCLLRAFSLVAAGCYLLAAGEARAALNEARGFDAILDEIAAEPVIGRCDLPTLFEALKEAMAENARLYPHLGPMALG